MSGVGAMAKLLSSNPSISPDLMNTHYLWSMVGLFFLVVTAILALIGLLRGWKSRISGQHPAPGGWGSPSSPCS